jgi:hypothetical protein
MVGLYMHSPVHFHGIILNLLSTRALLSLPLLLQLAFETNLTYIRIVNLPVLL